MNASFAHKEIFEEVSRILRCNKYSNTRDLPEFFQEMAVFLDRCCDNIINITVDDEEEGIWVSVYVTDSTLIEHFEQTSPTRHRNVLNVTIGKLPVSSYNFLYR